MSTRNKKVKVWVRIRPTAEFAHQMIDLQNDGKTVNVHCPKDDRRGVVNNQILDWSFKLDGIFHNATQEQVFDTVAADIVTGALDGYNGTMMCYGQTGAGKTFTMAGATENYRHRGLIPRAIAAMYRMIDDKPDHSIQVRVSYLEIYNETMFDLLSTLPESMQIAAQMSPLSVAEDETGVYVKGLSCHLVQNEEEALNLLFEGETNRAIAMHTLNKQSSRSHCIFTVYIESRSRVQSDAKYTVSKLNFVDLAGSERIGKTKSEGRTQQEAMYINKSLSFLEQTVIALADKRRDFIPFRQTKLTHCLKDSLGGNCNTLLVSNIWGEDAQVEETISTLRFATRMMCVASEPAVNERYDPALLVRKLEKEIIALKQELAMHDTLTNRTQISYEPLSEQQRFEIRQQVQQYIDAELDEIDIVNIRQIQGVFEAFREICLQTEKDMDEKYRARFTLIDKQDPQAIAAAQQAGIPIDENGELVGDPDGMSFGVGPAPPGTIKAASTVSSNKRRATNRGTSRNRASPAPRATSPAQSTKGAVADGTVSGTPSGEKKEERDEAGTPSSTAGGSTQKQKPPPRSSTPPARSDAFEEFKKDQGSEINRILAENKDILQGKKKAYADLARQLNYTKIEIDTSRKKLDQMKAERESQGAMLNQDGDVIISEEEYLQIQRLKDLKNAYRTDFEELKHLRAQVQYCQNLVDQCRQRLIQEFDHWYADSFLNAPPGELQSSAETGIGLRSGVKPQFDSEALVEDEQEKFERLQKELLMDDPNSAPYHNARMRLVQRKTYEAAMIQAQPYSTKKKPGTPVRQIRNPPPAMLQVQQ